mmetsp:Transcript_8276/g.20214  ORF Transcript_8276/g.20214 Transcript_8276/m.20214 type:complete len:129 (-) Transcript_8276:88-474(-)
MAVRVPLKVPYTPYNEIFSREIADDDDLNAVEDKISRVMRCADGKSYRGLQMREYVALRHTIMRQIRDRGTVVQYYVGWCRFPSGLRVIYESTGVENLVSLRWDDCVYPDEREGAVLDKFSYGPGAAR